MDYLQILDPVQVLFEGTFVRAINGLLSSFRKQPEEDQIAHDVRQNEHASFAPVVCIQREARELRGGTGVMFG